MESFELFFVVILNGFVLGFEDEEPVLKVEDLGVFPLVFVNYRLNLNICKFH